MNKYRSVEVKLYLIKQKVNSQYLLRENFMRNMWLIVTIIQK